MARITVDLATEQDRPSISRFRHQVYAAELGQHPENPQELLPDFARCAQCLPEGIGQRAPGRVHQHFSGAGNFLLRHLPATGPDAATVCRCCSSRNFYLRDFGQGSSLGAHALRIAVKDEGTNSGLLEILKWAISADAGILKSAS
ncbi:MAG: hypothetical protein WA628_11300 [Terriglobales bacterium]